MNVNVVKVTFDRLTNKINFSVSLLNQCLHAHVPLHVQQFYFTVAQVTATKHIESAGKKRSLTWTRAVILHISHHRMNQCLITVVE